MVFWNVVFPVCRCNFWSRMLQWMIEVRGDGMIIHVCLLFLSIRSVSVNGSVEFSTLLGWICSLVSSGIWFFSVKPSFALQSRPLAAFALHSVFPLFFFHLACWMVSLFEFVSRRFLKWNATIIMTLFFSIHTNFSKIVLQKFYEILWCQTELVGTSSWIIKAAPFFSVRHNARRD